jgi:hypothetical protein
LEPDSWQEKEESKVGVSNWKTKGPRSAIKETCLALLTMARHHHLNVHKIKLYGLTFASKLLQKMLVFHNVSEIIIFRWVVYN